MCKKACFSILGPIKKRTAPPKEFEDVIALVSPFSSLI